MRAKGQSFLKLDMIFFSYLRLFCSSFQILMKTVLLSEQVYAPMFEKQTRKEDISIFVNQKLFMCFLNISKCMDFSQMVTLL